MERRSRGRKREQDRLARVVKLRAEGLSLAKIAARLGVSRQG